MVDYRIEIVKDIADWIIAMTPLIAIGVTVYVAVLQYKLAQRNTEIDERNLKFSVYHERKKIYDATKMALGEVLREGAFSLSGYSLFLRETGDAEFLFGDDINEELELVRKNLIKIHGYRDKLEGVPVGEERNRICDEEAKLLEWAGDEFEVLSQLFARYLKID